MIKLPLRNLFMVLSGFLLPMSVWAIGSPDTNFFMKGLYHPMMVPAHLIVLFTLGLLSGQQGWQTMRFVLPVFIVVLVASLITTRYQSPSWDAEWVLLPLAVITGILIVFKWDMATSVSLMIACLAAVVIGMDSAVPRIPGLQPAKIYAHLTGSGVFSGAGLLIISLIALTLRNVVNGVILRILGAWSTAGAVLVVTLLFVTP